MVNETPQPMLNRPADHRALGAPGPASLASASPARTPIRSSAHPGSVDRSYGNGQADGHAAMSWTTVGEAQFLATSVDLSAANAECVEDAHSGVLVTLVTERASAPFLSPAAPCAALLTGATNMDSPARIAARWWADHLRTGNAPLDNGDNSPTGGMVAVLAKLSQADEPRVSAEQAQSFEDALAALIESNPGYASGWLTFGVDYHPDHVLCAAAEKAGVNLSMVTLPWKSRMTVSPAKVAVKCGYGAPYQTLFPRVTP